MIDHLKPCTLNALCNLFIIVGSAKEFSSCKQWHWDSFVTKNGVETR